MRFADFFTRTHTTSATAPPPPTPRRPYDPLEEGFEWCRERGRQKAIEGRDVTVDAAKVEEARADARGWIRCAKREYNPTTNPEDKELEHSIEKATGEVRKLDEELSKVRKARDDTQAAVPAMEPFPQPSQIVIATAVLGYALAFGSSLSVLPVFAGADDELLAFMLCLLIGGALGLLAVVSTFGLQPRGKTAGVIAVWEPGRSEWSLWGGLSFIIGFTLLRAAASTSWRDLAITTALTLLDIGILLYSKQEGESFRRADGIWRKRVDGALQKLLDAEHAQKAFTDLEPRVTAAEAHLAAVLEERRIRKRLDFDLGQMMEKAELESAEAYRRQVDANRGHPAPPRYRRVP